MWIRTQSNSTLLRVDGIQLSHQCNEFYLKTLDGSIVLGRYSSYGRAKQVLDMIQENIDYNIRGVFKMPEE